MATKSSAVMGSLNIPNVPPVAPAWPSADVVAQQSVSVTVLKPADGGVAAMAYIVGELGRALEHARRRHTFLDGVVELAAFRREFVPARERYTRRAGKFAALRGHWYSTSSSAVFEASMAAPPFASAAEKTRSARSAAPRAPA